MAQIVPDDFNATRHRRRSTRLEARLPTIQDETAPPRRYFLQVMVQPAHETTTPSHRIKRRASISRRSSGSTNLKDGPEGDVLSGFIPQAGPTIPMIQPMIQPAGPVVPIKPPQNNVALGPTPVGLRYPIPSNVVSESRFSTGSSRMSDSKFRSSQHGPVRTSTRQTKPLLRPKLVALVLLVAINRIVGRWINQETMLILEALQLLYVGFSIPFRLGLLYNPYRDNSMPTVVMYLIWAFDVLSDLIALLAAFETLKEMMISAPVASLGPMDLNFSSDTNDRRNSGYMSKLVKMSTTRQETMRRNSVFLAKETAMKPQFLLSSSWDKKRQIGSIHIFLDWFAMIPFDLFWFGNSNAMILGRLSKMLRMRKIGEVARLTKHALADHQLLAGFHNIGMSLLVGVILLSLVLIHWAACLFLLLAHLECGYNLNEPVDGKQCWGQEVELEGASIFRTYVYTMVVVGYGFPVPRTNAERIAVIGIQFMRFCIAGGIIGAYFFLFECQNRQANEFHDQVDGVKEYLTARRLSKDLQTKVLDFYEHFWSAQRGIDEVAIIATLPSHIRTQCYHYLRVKLLKNVPIFRNQPAHVLKRLMERMKRQCYGRLDSVVENGACKALYTVSRGRIALLNAKNSVLTHVTEGQCFGLSCIVSNSNECHAARAETFCDVYTLDRASIEEVVLLYAQLGEITWHAMIAEAQLILQKNMTNAMLVKGSTFVVKPHDNDKWTVVNSKFRKRWEICVVCVLVLFLIDVPLHIAFNSPKGWFVYSVRLVLDIFLVIDFLFRARYFAYVEMDTVITNSWFIWREYLRHGLVLDAISNIPFAMAADLLPSSTPQWLFLTLQACEWLRFLRMRSLFSTLSNVLKQYHVNNTTYIIVCIVLCVPFTCHIGGCVWYWISKITSSPSHNGHEGNHMTLKECLSWARDFDNCTWLDFDHAHFGHSSDYVRAFYWSVVSLVTVQFGSILPFTDAECVYMFLWLFLSSIANYGALGALANAVTRINWAISAKQLQVAVAHRFMLSERVSRTVRRDVNDYYKHHWTQSTEHQVMSVLKPLPDNLRQEIQTFLHEKSVKHVKIFMHVNADGLRFIYSVMKHQSYKRHEFLVRAGDACDTIYIITRGVVEALLSLDDFQVPVQLHYPGDCIGEAAFIQKRPHDLSFRVVGGSLDVSVLDRHEFMTGAMHFTHLGPEIDAIAAELFQSETKFVEQIERNLRRAHIYRTLNQSPTLYIEPKLDDYLIRPGSMYYRLWELLISAVVTYNLIQISFRIAMLLTPSHDLLLSIWIIDIICDIIFLVDMYIKYNHLIHMDKNGDEVVSVSLIRANYLQGAFKLEALSSLPLYYFGDFRIMTACRLPRLLRCYQLPSLLHTFHMFVQEQTSSAIISEGLEFLKLFIGLVLASHLAATGLYFISYQQYTSMHTSSSNDHGVGVWYEHDFVIEEDPHSLSMVYLRAFYWGLGVLSSFDYMDMEVAMVGETLWFCAVALSGVLFIGVVIGQVTTAIFNANKEIREVEMQVDNFAFYAKMKNLPPYLIRRATLFFQFQLDCNRGMDAHVIFEDLPQSLCLELFHDLYSSMLAKIPIFSSFTKGQLNTIAEKLHTRLYLPGDNIVVEGDMGSSLYFLKQGLGEKYLRSCHLIIAPCYKGAVFGEAGFFLSMRYVYCVRAVKCCEILCLSKADWSEAWSADVRAKLEAKVMRDIQHELSILRRNIHAIKQNFGITRPIPLKLTMMLESSSSAGIPQTTADVSGRNFFEYLKHTAPSKAKVNPLATAPLREFTIWSLGPPPAAVWKPDSLFRQTWDIMMLGVVIYYAFLIPFRASFIFVPTMPPLWLIIWLIWDYFLDILCIVDTILRWQVFYVFVEGEVQTNRAILRRHYQAHGHFYADLLSLLPIEVFVLAFPHRNGWEMISLWRLNRMIRLSHFSHLLSTFQHILNRHHWFHDYKMIFQYIVAYVGPFFLVCHWVGCMWFHVSYTYRHMDSPSWLVTAGYINANETISDGIPIEFSETTQLTSLNLYLASLYYAVSSLTSQSLGDVFSRNPLETWLTIGIMIFSIAFYGLLVGILSEMVEDRLNPRATFEQRMVDISTFFNYRMLPFQFFIQTSRFFRTQWQEQLARTEDEFLGILSTTIREDIAMFVKQNFVKNLSFINHVEEVFVRALVTKLHTEDYIMSDVIFQLGDVGRVLYFINVGHITLVTSKNASKTCNVWDFFGGTSLFTDTGRQATAIANVNCTMFLLYFEDFDRVIQRFPEYYEPCRNEWNVSDAVELDNANRITQVPN